MAARKAKAAKKPAAPDVPAMGRVGRKDGVDVNIDPDAMKAAGKKSPKGKGPKPLPKGTQKSFDPAQAEEDAQQQKVSESAKCVKAAHGYAREMNNRFVTARLATSTPEAIEHDLTRILELAKSVKSETESAMKALHL